jgi:hypothetical protein
MVSKHRSTRRRQRGGNENLPAKPKSMCQCYGDDGKGCANESVGNSPFCEQHKNTCPKPPLTGWEPTYEDLKWYDEPLERRRSHNCYSTAMMAKDDKIIQKCRESGNNTSVCRSNFHQPGARFGGRFELNAEERRTCENVERLVIQDNPDITKTTFYDKCPAGTSKIAYMVHKGVDFHFEPQLKDGMWGGKPGSNKTYTVDAVGKPIFNPDLSSHDYRWQGSELNYKPCGFLCVPRNRTIELGSGADDPKKQQDGGRHRRSRKQPLIPMVGLGWNDPKHKMRYLSRRATRLATQRRRWTQRKQKEQAQF